MNMGSGILKEDNIKRGRFLLPRRITRLFRTLGLSLSNFTPSLVLVTHQAMLFIGLLTREYLEGYSFYNHTH